MNTSAPLVEFRGIPPLPGVASHVSACVARLNHGADHTIYRVLIHRPTWSVVPPFYVETRVEVVSGGRPRVVVSEARRIPAYTEDVIVGALQPTVDHVFAAVARHLTAPPPEMGLGSPPQPEPP